MFLKKSKLLFSILILSLVLLACRQNNQSNPPGENNTQNPLFTDITKEVNLEFNHDAGFDSSYFMPQSVVSGGAFIDFDNDGDLDIFLIHTRSFSKQMSVKKNTKNRLFRQNQDGLFEDVTAGSGLQDIGYSMGVAVGDINNDGFNDLYISSFGADKLFQNNGNGTFSDITQRAGISNEEWGSSVTMLDFNVDGFLDIYVTHYVDYDESVKCRRPQDYCGPGRFAGVSDVLFMNNGDGTFINHSKISNISSEARKGLGVTSGDFNDDGYPDIYVANDNQPNNFWINQKNGKFLDIAMQMGVAVNSYGYPEASMGVTVGDVNLDGKFDFFVTHFRGQSNTLYRFGGSFGYEDATRRTGVGGPGIPFTGFGAGFFDYDHDGDLDLAVANGRIGRGQLLKQLSNPQHWDYYSELNLLLENDGTGYFNDISNRCGTFGSEVETSRALIFGDVDNDGDLDFLVTNSGGPARLYRNDSVKKGNWLSIRAVDPALKRDVIGAEIMIEVKKKILTRIVSASDGYLAGKDLRCHFGLGQIDRVDGITIMWPGGEREYFSGVETNQFIVLKKGEGRSAL